ncbi:hypothetical protein BH24CHL4_BH24CHL4_13190 [soil metagenome]
MLSIRRDPFDDPLVRTWDAVVTGTAHSGHVDQQALTVLNKLHDSFGGPEIDARFLSRLESQLFGLQSQNGSGSATAASSSLIAIRVRGIGRDERESDRPSKLIRLIIDNLAIAAILAIVLGGLAVTFVSSRPEPESSNPVPAIIDSRDELEQALNPPSIETLLDITVNPSDFGAPPSTTWEQLDFSLTYLEPGAEYSTDHPFFSCCPSFIVLQVMQGAAEFTAGGPATVYRLGAEGPEPTLAGGIYELARGDSVAFSTSSQATIRNLSQDELQLLNGRAVDFAAVRTTGLPPEGYRKEPLFKSPTIDPLQTDVVDFRFERVLMNPGSLFTVESRSNERLFGWYPEQFASPARFLPGDESVFNTGEMGEFLGAQFAVHDFPEGPYTIFNVDDEPITLHFLHVIESAPQPGDTGNTSENQESLDDLREALTPPVTESLLDISIDPADLGTLGPDDWDRMDFSLVHVEPNEQFSTDHPLFSCCPGMGVFQLRQSTATFLVDGVVHFYPAGSGGASYPMPPGTPLALGPGDTAVFALEHPAVITNTGADELLMLGGFAYQYNATPGTRPKPEGFAERPMTKPMAVELNTAGMVDVSFERTMLDPGELMQIEVVPGVGLSGWHPDPNALVRMLFGALDKIPADYAETFPVQTFSMSNFAAGPYTLFNDGNHPATQHFMRIAATGEQPGDGSTTSETLESTDELRGALSPPVVETLLNATVDPASLGAALPSTWNTMEFSLSQLQAGGEFSTSHPYYANFDGNVVFQVLEGNATISVEGPADIYREASPGVATRIEAGTSIELVAGDAISLATSTIMTLANTGPDDLLFLSGRALDRGDTPITEMLKPSEYRDSRYERDMSLDPLASDTFSLQFERVVLVPYQFLVVESLPGERLLGWYPEESMDVRFLTGSFDQMPSGQSGDHLGTQFNFHIFPEGPYTLFTSGDDPVTLYFMRVTEIGDQIETQDVAQENAASQPSGTSLDIPITPSDFGAAPPSAWDTSEFTTVRVAAGEEFSTDAPYFSCCSGVHVYQVQQGVLDLIAEGPVDVYRSGSATAKRTKPGIPIALAPGDAAVLSMLSPATFTNPSPQAELLMLSGQAFEHDSDLPIRREALPPDGYTHSPKSLDVEMESIPAASVEFSFETVHLEPGALTQVEIDPEQRLMGWYPEPDSMVRILEGSHEFVPADDQGTFLVRTFTMRIYDPGPYTLYNASETATTLQLMRMTPSQAAADATPAAATPEAGTQAAIAQPETILQLVLDPNDLGAAATTTWNWMEFAEVHMAPGEFFSTAEPYFAAMGGVAVFQVQQGTLGLIVSGALDVYRNGTAAPERIFTSDSVELGPGDTAVFALESIATVTNTGSEELIMLGGNSSRRTEISGSVAPPAGYAYQYSVIDHTMPSPDSNRVTVSFERVSLSPDSLIHMDIEDDMRAIGFASHADVAPHWKIGSFDTVPEQESGMTLSRFVLESFLPGSYTVFNPYDEEVTFYLMRLEDVTPAPRSPRPRLKQLPRSSSPNLRRSCRWKSYPPISVL